MFTYDFLSGTELEGENVGIIDSYFERTKANVNAN